MIQLPDDVSFIIRQLNSRGHKAYAVGGCVRDSILGRNPGDWDITTSATPIQIKEIFEKTIDTGLKHGTVTIHINHGNYEITTFRLDGVYSDNRRPDSVEFTTSLESDLSRRDFTINAIAFHPIEGLIDPFSGIGDIVSKIIRTVGNADERFKEDALRMLRAMRFSSQLNFAIDNQTLQSIRENCGLIQNVSMERIRIELTKILTSNQPENFKLLYETKLLQYIMPEFEACFHTPQNNRHHIFDVANHILTSLSKIDNDIALRWVMLLHDIGKPPAKSTDDNGIDHFYGHPQIGAQLAQSILQRLKFDNKTTEKVLRLVKHHDIDFAPNSKSIRRTVKNVGDDIFIDLLKVKEADIRAQNPVYLNERLYVLKRIREIYAEIKEQGQCLNLSTLAINGRDIMGLGVKEGTRIGEILNMLLEACIENPELNTREKLLELLAHSDGSDVSL